MVDQQPADIDNETTSMMEVEAPNSSSEGGAASGPPPRLMISKMVRVFVPMMIRVIDSFEYR